MARRTPVYEAHRGLDPRWTEFSGWEMPLSYRSIAEEHRAVREHCGLFDVSHMGEIEIRGPEAGAVCQALTVNDVRRLAVGDGQYTLLCNERGGVLDDLIPYIYGELHQLASRALSLERAGHTLQPTALVNEVYLRLSGKRLAAALPLPRGHQPP